jgi:hypothetical protein
MDALDNLIYATLRRPLTGPRPIQSDYVATPAGYGVINNPPYYFDNVDKMSFVCWDDIDVIERSLNQHWYDISRQPAINYQWVFGGTATVITDFSVGSPYHLITAYLAENSRIVQIFQRMIDMYLHDEDFGIPGNPQVIRWIQNTEKLFFKNCNTYSPQSAIRSSSEAMRRNAYHRLFGLELAFGEPDGTSNASFKKAKASNRQFIVLFEQYLSEVWQAYVNIRNAVGPNSTDNINLSALAQQLRELLNARRGYQTRGNQPYSHENLAYEEYFSVLMLTWFTFALSYDNSPIVQFLNCQSNTVGERLLKLGARVGLPAHQKSEPLFELAGAAGGVLRAIESGVLENPTWITNMFANPPMATTVPLLNDLLTVINNWEKATGHKIKNREANIAGTVKIATTARPTALVNN